jgi:hypothetical protein
VSEREKTADGLFVEPLRAANEAFDEAYNKALDGPVASLARYYGVCAAILAYREWLVKWP